MRQLLLYGFAPGASFQGQLVGALERLESGGALRVVDALFVVSDAQTGEVAAIDLQEHSASAALGRMLSFRLDERARRQATDRALAADAVRDLAATLEPGGAVAAVLVEHVWAGALEDAVTRSGGAALLDRMVDAEALADVRADLVAAAR